MIGLDAWAQQPMTRGEFEAFLTELARSVAADPESWPNASLDQFLGGAGAWLADMDGYFANRGEAVPSAPSWQLFAQILLAGRVYE